VRLRKYSVVQLRAAVAASKSMRQVLSQLNVIPAGGNYDVLRKAIHHWRLDTSHFTGSAWNRGMRPGYKQPVAYYLRSDVQVQSARLARRLLQEGLLPRKCSNCKLDSWQGGPIPLELHHGNGKRNDNRLENLSMLCPNCHALTPTYRGRNRSKA
jgi:hypothetical protein